MNKKVLGVVLLLLAALSFVGYKYFTQISGGLAGLKVTSIPPSSVYLGDKLIGRTPYEDKVSSGEQVFKLIPEGTGNNAVTWQTRIDLNSGVLTFVNRELGDTELSSAGEILTLEKITEKDAQIAVITNPDGSVISLDGQEKGTSPLIMRNVTSGDHDITISSPGFLSRTLKVKATEGYKLMATFQLALADKSATTAGETTGDKDISKDKKGNFVVISDTPTGFLRVRTEPSTSSSEAAQVKPGERFKYLEEQDGWYKIIYEEGKEGWISGRYAEKEE
ncbi:PEGA domain-containing protein [Candidatus Gottesmanbacteria bacterium]|nr:PEGA domain-containing protein [Candidatus Gottesmanbacteria bacterium]